MLDRPISGNDAVLYLEHVADHGLLADTAWLIDAGRFPVGCRVLDAGCGSGTLVMDLAKDKRFARSVIGVELSAELASHAGQAVKETGGTIVHADFLTWVPVEGWRPDTVVMSYFLHHTHDIHSHLHRAAALLSHGGRLYVIDRVPVDDLALSTFPIYWDQQYRAAHEWNEEPPRLTTVEKLTETAGQAGFDFVRLQICPHDNRPGAEAFPKTLIEFWRHESQRPFPAILVVSPAHSVYVEEICNQLDLAGLNVAGKFPIPYTDELIRTIYERCPWCELLVRFVGKNCPDRMATALPLLGDNTGPELLDRLTQFKKAHRDRWPSIVGPEDADGSRAIILPFHVPEPYEAEALARVVGLSAGLP